MWHLPEILARSTARVTRLPVSMSATCSSVAVLVGGGKPALPSDARAELELLDDRRLSNGVVYLRYRIPT
jgi:hypothetical protein